MPDRPRILKPTTGTNVNGKENLTFHFAAPCGEGEITVRLIKLGDTEPAVTVKVKAIACKMMMKPDENDRLYTVVIPVMGLKPNEYVLEIIINEVSTFGGIFNYTGPDKAP